MPHVGVMPCFELHISSECTCVMRLLALWTMLWLWEPVPRRDAEPKQAVRRASKLLPDVKEGPSEGLSKRKVGAQARALWRRRWWAATAH